MTTGHTWSVRATTGGVLVERGPADSAPTPAATVTGSPQNLFLWLWNRTDDTAVDQDGDKTVLDQFRGLRVTSTQ